ncbi:MAG: methyltransferase domain-containing protein [Euryarchaeota archaeon]|nr:methyltransferase domain-containing protein [Euryarchaeota archaeon]
MHRKKLAIALSRIPDHPSPKSRLEQVRTPGMLAADVLLLAAEEGDIAGRRVLDPGCGTGVFTIGAALLDAETAVGFDTDSEALAVARDAAADASVADRVHFQEVDVVDADPALLAAEAGLPAQNGRPFDTVVMNPPFGADLTSRKSGGDRVFLSLAFRAAEAVYSLHLARTEVFLVAFARDAGRSVERIAVVPFPLKARFAHHKEAVRDAEVGVYRFLPTDG